MTLFKIFRPAIYAFVIPIPPNFFDSVFGPKAVRSWQNVLSKHFRKSDHCVKKGSNIYATSHN